VTYATLAKRGQAPVWLAIAAYAILLWETAPRWPDDWDGVGFLESVNDFDLARFHPHPPGYPVYVALLRVAARVAGSPIQACKAVAVSSGAAAIALVWDATRRTVGPRAAWIAATLVAVAPAIWHAFSGVGSEALALACACACAWGLSARVRSGPTSATVLGLGAGLGLGVRLSWAPLYVAALALASRESRALAWSTAALAVASWAVPFVALVGPHTLLVVSAAHFGGHAARWGGTVLTEPGAVRLLWFARDLFVDGLGVEPDPLGLAIAALIAIVAAYALLAWHASRWCGWRSAVGAAAPYVLWVGLGQNLRDQPRHVVPLVAMVCAGLAIASTGRRAARLACGLLVVLVALRTAGDAYARRTIPPPGQQLVALADRQPSPKHLVVFGGQSMRFFETAETPSRALLAGSLGEAEMALTRLDQLPTRVWVTNEVAGLSDSRSPLERIALLCRPARLDRRMPCLGVYEWKLPYLPAQ
jgi:hypothetical protein